MKEKKNLLKTIALVVITVIAGNIGPRLFNIITKQPLNNSNTLKGRVMIMNKDCPFVIDENPPLPHESPAAARIPRCRTNPFVWCRKQQ